jgi:hypothetical protein
MLIDSMVNAEWQALLLERKAAEATTDWVATHSLRLGAEFRRILLLLDRDFDRTTPKPPPSTPSRRARRLSAILAEVEDPTQSSPEGH